MLKRKAFVHFIPTNSSPTIFDRLIEISRNKLITELHYSKFFVTSSAFERQNAKKLSELIVTKPNDYAAEPSVIFFRHDFPFLEEFNSLAPLMIPFTEKITNHEIKKPPLSPPNEKKLYTYLNMDHLLEAFIGFFIAVSISFIVFVAELSSVRFSA